MCVCVYGGGVGVQGVFTYVFRSVAEIEEVIISKALCLCPACVARV